MADSDVKITVKAEDQTKTGIGAADATFKKFGETLKATQGDMAKVAEHLTRMGVDLSGVGGKMDGYIAKLKAATPENARLAGEMAKVIEAFDKGEMSAQDAAAALEKLNQQYKKNQQETSTFGDRLKSLGGNLNTVVEGLTGFNIAQLSVAGGFIAIGKGMQQAISNYSEYAETVDKMAMSTGMMTEEVSRLIQVADDFRVDQSALENAMKLALQNGFEPSIENLAQLSDEFVSTTSVTERAEKMQRIFGRSWEDLVPLLEKGGDAIRQASAGIEESLIITREAVDANREYIAAMDNLQDSWTGVQNNLARGAIPALADFLSLVSESGDVADESMPKWVRWTGPLAAFWELFNIGKAAVTDNADAVTDWSDAEREAMRASAALEEQTKATTFATEELAYADEFAGDQGRSLAGVVEWQEQNLKKAAEQAEEYKEKLGDLRDATANLMEAQQNLNDTLGDEMVGRLDKWGISGKKLEEAYAAIDEKMGTNYLATHKNEKAMDDLAQQFAQGKITAEELAAGMEAQKPAWEALDKDLEKAKDGFDDAKEAWNDFIRQIGAANGMHVTITADVLTNYGSGAGAPAGTGTGGGRGRHGGEAEGATGFSEVVPYGSNPWETSLYAAHPGETVTITPAGTPGNTGAGAETNVTLNNYNTVASQAQLESLVAETTRRTLAALTGR